ncbi:hypothetical protein D6C98_01549 [Aureobasidium pullulans]|uniref:Uncharacterized protein n=1 Tax=Aureobasidium pullulans TaxID=5580 RepID=A0A4S9SL70_AURPU|nr:hypothetical protein D6D29_09618 [Aureobasidium pullulans]THW12257.1 hypothetical protein D6D24_06703 [Aureobasidium pullulans]THW29614.1 hypothetical protein D6D23_00839 [Aureobasidium pullulans]THW64052.1 hypothetical protein D6D20_03182 [Aureobasidium pullulans]THY62504.1 hypothetical protein D6C98_01549 [Aureobasidium pullulans]
MPVPSSLSHSRPISDEPPNKRARTSDASNPTNSSPHLLISPTAMTPSSSAINTHSYISHVDLEILSNKVKKLQSDLGGLTSQTWGGPGKDKILDCKHDVDGLAQSLKQMEALNTDYSKSLNSTVGETIDKIFERRFAEEMQKLSTEYRDVINDGLGVLGGSRSTKTAIKESLLKDSDVLLDFEKKFTEHLRRALAEIATKRLETEILKEFGA